MGLQAVQIIRETLDNYISWVEAQGHTPSPKEVGTLLNQLKHELVEEVSKRCIEQPDPEESSEPRCSCTSEMTDLPGCCESPYCFRRIEPDFDILKDDEDEGFTFADHRERKLPF